MKNDASMFLIFTRCARAAERKIADFRWKRVLHPRARVGGVGSSKMPVSWLVDTVIFRENGFFLFLTRIHVVYRTDSDAPGEISKMEQGFEDGLFSFLCRGIQSRDLDTLLHFSTIYFFRIASYMLFFNNFDSRRNSEKSHLSICKGFSTIVTHVASNTSVFHLILS